MEKITALRAVELLEEVANAKGADFVYNPEASFPCYYVPFTSEDDDDLEDLSEDPRQTTGCLVGESYKRAGADPAALEALGTMRATFLNEKNSTSGYGWRAANDVDLAWEIAKNVTEHAARVFSAAQTVQDNGGTWGEAAAAGRQKYYELLGNGALDGES